MKILFSFILLHICLVPRLSAVNWPPPTCLTGFMKEVQSWVDAKGVLLRQEQLDEAYDLSASVNPVKILERAMQQMKDNASVVYLSVARCRLTRIPTTMFSIRDANGKFLSETVQYLTLYGNSFDDISHDGSYDVHFNASDATVIANSVEIRRRENVVAWSVGLRDVNFRRLKELDLRSCAVKVLDSKIFMGMPALAALYLSSNEITYLDSEAFFGLKSLKHLDLSKNYGLDNHENSALLNPEAYDSLALLKNLQSLDLSFTRLIARNYGIISKLGPRMTRLSLCGTGLTELPEDIFNKTSIQILDVSNNKGIFSDKEVLKGLEKHLRVLYAKEIGLQSMEIFKGFHRLEILDVSSNEIRSVSPMIAESLKQLEILNLDKNRLTAWFSPTFSLMRNLKLLSLKENNINLISEGLLLDVANVSYLALSGNFIVCNCYSREFYNMAVFNENYTTNYKLNSMYMKESDPKIAYHTAFEDFNYIIEQREEMTPKCVPDHCDDMTHEFNGKFVLLDYHPLTYMCLKLPESQSVEFSQVDACNTTPRDIDYDQVVAQSWGRLYLMLTLIPAVLFVMLFGYVFRRNFRYCFITMRNSAMLGLVHNSEAINDDAIFHFDVFVSYCNEDRGWVLDHLIPQLEADGTIRACLHERDFQVGQSILENIVSSMDRSRSIMLIISQRFLLSKWCQFEMHVAQHRLLETRREDLTLVLLEDIPRKLRPNTLHYLMLTKTYIVWPKEGAERDLFWRRLKRSFMTLRPPSYCDTNA